MTNSTMELDIVSAEASIFTGSVESIVVSGKDGELGIFPGHTALLTALKPGQVYVVLNGGASDVFYISGGMLEVQPDTVTILADTAVRASDLDEAAAIAAKERAEKALADQEADIEYSAAMAELAEAAAQINAIKKLRDTRGRH